MDPITLIALYVFGLAGAATVVVLTMSNVRGWFGARQHLLRNRRNVGFTFLKELNRNGARVIQGVFSQNDVLDYRVLSVDQLDGELAAAHHRRRLVYYS